MAIIEEVIEAIMGVTIEVKTEGITEVITGETVTIATATTTIDHQKGLSNRAPKSQSLIPT